MPTTSYGSGTDARGDAPFAKKEPAVLHLCGFVAILLTGSGRSSLDRLKFQ